MSEPSAVPDLSRQDVVRITIISEGVLLLVGAFWFLFWPETAWSSIAQLTPLLTGALAALPLFFLNFGLGKLADHISFFQEFTIFRTRYVEPICKNLVFSDILLIALLSGIAEELVFRGLFLSLLLEVFPFFVAHTVVAIVFAYVHLLSKVRDFPLVFLVYIAAAVALAALGHHSGSIMSPIACHAVFNFLSLLTFRVSQKPSNLDDK